MIGIQNLRFLLHIDAVYNNAHLHSPPKKFVIDIDSVIDLCVIIFFYKYWQFSIKNQDIYEKSCYEYI